MQARLKLMLGRAFLPRESSLLSPEERDEMTAKLRILINDDLSADDPEVLMTRVNQIVQSYYMTDPTLPGGPLVESSKHDPLGLFSDDEVDPLSGRTFLPAIPQNNTQIEVLDPEVRQQRIEEIQKLEDDVNSGPRL